MIKEALLAILLAQESPNGEMVGDHGRAVGRLQITQAAVDDVNQYTGLHFTLIQMRDLEIAKFVCYTWLAHYEPLVERKFGRALNDRDRARLWNRGYKGMLRYHGLRPRRSGP